MKRFVMVGVAVVIGGCMQTVHDQSYSGFEEDLFQDQLSDFVAVDTAPKAAIVAYLPVTETPNAVEEYITPVTKTQKLNIPEIHENTITEAPSALKDNTKTGPTEDNTATKQPLEDIRIQADNGLWLLWTQEGKPDSVQLVATAVRSAVLNDTVVTYEAYESGVWTQKSLYIQGIIEALEGQE